MFVAKSQQAVRFDLGAFVAAQLGNFKTFLSEVQSRAVVVFRLVVFRKSFVGVDNSEQIS